MSESYPGGREPPAAMKSMVVPSTPWAPLKPWAAVPNFDKAPRIGFVATDDRGCNSKGLFPDSVLIIEPCEEFLGVGIYQLSVHGSLIVRRCRLHNAETIEVTTDGVPPGTGRELISIDDFEDQVCGLVLAQIEGVNAEWTAHLYALRGTSCP